VGFLEVLKRSNKHEPYYRAKLLRSLILATDHLTERDKAFALAETIETNLLFKLKINEKVITSSDIASETLKVLKRYDTRSYVKYLSYQTQTLDARDLRTLLKR
jgi:transcriptional regulator NrdR family protein